MSKGKEYKQLLLLGSATIAEWRFGRETKKRIGIAGQPLLRVREEKKAPTPKKKKGGAVPRLKKVSE